MLQVPFLPSLLVTSHIWLVPITTHLQFAEQEKFCGPSINTASIFVNGKMVVCDKL
jgi:hypothetical protein